MGADRKWVRMRSRKWTARVRLADAGGAGCVPQPRGSVPAVRIRSPAAENLRTSVVCCFPAGRSPWGPRVIIPMGATFGGGACVDSYREFAPDARTQES